MIWSKLKVLELCYKLKDSPLEFIISPGTRVARGYADVGFEEFCVLQGNKMVSLQTGLVSDLELDHLFVVPTVEELLNILPKEFKILIEGSSVFINNREYDSLEIGLLRELLCYFEIKNPSPRIVAV